MEKARRNREKMEKQRKKELEQVQKQLQKNSNSSRPGEGATEWQYFLTLTTISPLSVQMSSAIQETRSSVQKGLIAIELPLDELKPKCPDMDFIFTEQYSGFFLVLAEWSLLFGFLCFMSD